jgi:hypothetical protein
VGEAGDPMDRESIRQSVNQLIDEYRDQCLWFLREGYYPSTRDEQDRILAMIQRYGDVAAWRRASELRSWLSRRSSETSAAR